MGYSFTDPSLWVLYSSMYLILFLFRGIRELKHRLLELRLKKIAAEEFFDLIDEHIATSNSYELTRLKKMARNFSSSVRTVEESEVYLHRLHSMLRPQPFDIRERKEL